MDPRATLTILSGAAGLFALYRLAAGHLLKTYPWLGAFLAAGSLQGLIMLAGHPDSREYAFWWGVTIPFILAVRVAAVVEAWRLLISSSLGLRALAARLALGSILVGLAVSLVNGLDGLGFTHLSTERLMFHILSIGLRYSYSVLCVVCGILWAWAALFRVEVSSNLFRHLGILTGYFACNTAGYLLINLLPGSAVWVGACTAGASAAWYVLWGLLFSESGERHFGVLLAPNVNLES